MSRYLPHEVFEFEPAPKVPERRYRAWGLDLRAWLFLGMGLAGILTVALVVTADSVYADIDAMRGVSASVPRPEDPPITKIPFLGGLLSKIHDIAPSFFGPSPDSVLPPPAPSSPPPTPPSSPSSLPVAQPIPTASASARPAPTPSNPPAPLSSPSPRPTSAPTAPSTPAPAASPTPASTASPTLTPTASPWPSPSPVPTAAPALAISIDRGATAAFDLTRLVPGDSMTRAITVQNTGSGAFRYTVSATHTASTALWTDAVDGLQLTVRDAGGAVRYAGPLAGLGSLAGPSVLAPGTTELLSYTVDFPASASNALEGLDQDLTLVFAAIAFP